MKKLSINNFTTKLPKFIYCVNRNPNNPKSSEKILHKIAYKQAICFVYEILFFNLLSWNMNLETENLLYFISHVLSMYF